MLLHGLLFFFGTEDVARSGVPEISKRALRVGIGLVDIVARVYLFFGNCIKFQLGHRNIFSKKSTNWNRNWLSISYSLSCQTHD